MGERERVVLALCGRTHNWLVVVAFFCFIFWFYRDQEMHKMHRPLNNKVDSNLLGTHGKESVPMSTSVDAKLRVCASEQHIFNMTTSTHQCATICLLVVHTTVINGRMCLTVVVRVVN